MRTFEGVINGHRYSYASLRIVVNGTAYPGIRSVNYSSALEPGIIYGSDGYKLGRTPGKVKHEADFQCYRREWDDIRAALGDNFGRSVFDIEVQYAEAGDEGVKTDLVGSCRVVKVEHQNEEGPEASKVNVTVDPMDILYNKFSIDRFSRDVSTAKPFWALNSSAGFEGPVYPPNPFDLVIIGGERLPGLCKLKALPNQQLDRQKVPGREGATILWRGYVPGPIDVECLMWLPEQWEKMQALLDKLWQKANKTLAAGGGGAKKESAGSLKKAAAIAERAALDISYPPLQRLGISRVVVVGVSIPEEGPVPQSRIINFKLQEYVPPGNVEITTKAKGSGPPKFKRSAELGSKISWIDGNAPTPGRTEAGPLQSLKTPPARGTF